MLDYFWIDHDSFAYQSVARKLFAAVQKSIRFDSIQINSIRLSMLRADGSTYEAVLMKAKCN